MNLFSDADSELRSYIGHKFPNTFWDHSMDSASFLCLHQKSTYFDPKCTTFMLKYSI